MAIKVERQVEATRAAPEAALRAGGPAAVLGAARAAAESLAAHAAEQDRSATFPAEGIDAIWAAGLGNLSLPAAQGGVGADLRTTAEAVALLGAGDASAALVLVMHLVQLRMLALPEGGAPAALREAVVASSLRGPALANALRVEPELGTPARGGVPATRARLVSGAGGRAEWSLSGRKTFSTGAPGLRWLIVWGATADDDPLGVRTGWFAARADARGVAIEESWDHLGMRASASHDIVLNDVRLPLDHAFGLALPGAQPTSGRSDELIGWALVLLLAVYRGAAHAARDWLVAHLRERAPANLGAPLATLPRFQVAVGEIAGRIAAADRLCESLAADIDAGGGRAEQAAADAPSVKVTVTRELIEAVGGAVALVGNAGLSRNFPLERHYRDVLCSRVHTPQDDSVLLASGLTALATHRPQGA